MAGVFCCGHVGVLLAESASNGTSAHARIEAQIAEGRKQREDGHLANALLLLNEAGKLAHQNHDPQLEAKALMSSAGCHIRLFRYRQALGEANQALELALAAKDNTLAGAAAGNLATVYAQLGDFANAQAKARQSVNCLRNSARKDYLARALYNYG